ncbi:HAD-IA family hydrolase [Deinococcus caeni]|uniref:HAD-IA family hydrolase n=1 Tax=Deinococcus caeni TaxID=569127 RepID=UPI00360E5545
MGTWDAFDPWAGLPDHVQQNRQAVYAQLLETIHADIQAADLRPGVRNVLDAIRPAGLRLALATSSDRAWVTRWLEQHDLLRHFETLATRDDVTRVKPDPELYTLAVHRLGLHPHECLAVEDSLNGATAAAAAGLHVVVVPNEVTRTQAFLPEWGRVEGYEGGWNPCWPPFGADASGGAVGRVAPGGGLPHPQPPTPEGQGERRWHWARVSTFAACLCWAVTCLASTPSFARLVGPRAARTTAGGCLRSGEGWNAYGR